MQGISARIFYIALFFCLQAPLWHLIFYAFNSGSTYVFEGFSLRWFVALWENDVTRMAFTNSFVVSVASATIGLLLSLFLAYVSTCGFGARVTMVRKTAHMMALMPEMVVSISVFLIAVYVREKFHYNIVGSYSLIIWVGSLYMLGPMLYLISSQMRVVGRDVFDAARDLGASASYAFWRVLLIVILPSVLGVWLVGILWMMDDFLITLFLGGGRIMNLQMYMYFVAAGEPNPLLNAIACTTLLLLLSMILLLWICICCSRKRSMNFIEKWWG